MLTISRSLVILTAERVCVAVESVTMRKESVPVESETGKGVGSPSELEPSSLPWGISAISRMGNGIARGNGYSYCESV